MSIPTSGPFADQNLTALFPKLMKFTPQQLSQVQGVPGWFLASVLGAQQAERNNGAQTTPPTQTVVQQVIDQAVGAPPAGQAMPAPQAPTQMASQGGYIHDYGVASLPYEANYGHGGIVSFYGGGGTGKENNIVDDLHAGLNPTDSAGKPVEQDISTVAKFASEHPALAAAVAATGAAGVGFGLTSAPVLEMGATGWTAVRLAVSRLGPYMTKRILGNAALGTTAGGIAYDVANTPLPTKAPPGDTRKAFMNPDALGMANPDPIDPPAEDPAEDPAAADYRPDPPPVYGPAPGGLPSIVASGGGKYPEFEAADLPPEYKPEVEYAKQAAANERFHVDPDYAKNELAKNAAQIQKTKQDAIAVFSGEALSRLGLGIARNHSGRGFLSGIAEAAPEYAAATREGIESARTRTDLLDTRGELLRGQEQERNVGRADAAFADQKKREDERFAAKNANNARKQEYSVTKYNSIADRAEKAADRAVQLANINTQYATINATANTNYATLLEQIRNNDLQYQSIIETAKINNESKQYVQLLEDRRALQKFVGDSALQAVKAFDKLPDRLPEDQRQAYVDKAVEIAKSAYTGKRPGEDNLSVEGGNGSTRQGLGSLGIDVGKNARRLYTPPSLRKP